MDNLWTRRSNNNKLSLSTGASNTNGATNSHDHPTRSYSLGRRHCDNPFHNSKPQYNPLSPSTVSLNSPTTGASSAFGLGSGAFASFGTSKAPKTPGSMLDFSNVVGSSKAPAAESKDSNAKRTKSPSPEQKSSTQSSSPSHPLRHNWVIWFRPPMNKANGYIQYEKTLHPMAGFENVEDFLKVYRHLKRPSSLQPVSDYHIFKKGIRPVWEDNENKKGGKWIVRLKKGVADRYWEDLIFAIIGDQFAEASEEVCGAVLSVRNGEDILSIWARNDGGRVLKIREIMKRILGFPPDTKVEWKSHDSSIQQRTAFDEHRKEKANYSTGSGRNSHKAIEEITNSPAKKV
ncbi:hypothetical protein K3495_g7228 [Podosphaera aphanis]|nr:hypothetical protein K3495_g7228 [Podosphaera aphanis]